MNIIFSLFCFGLIITIAYCTIILLFCCGWKKTSESQTKISKENLPFISVIVPFRNEKENLPILISALINQTYPAEKYEIIAVDDHSTDNSAVIFSTNLNFKNLIVLNNESEGKKNALKTGILKSCGQLIITTDADCLPPQLWLETIVENYLHSSPAMLSGGVKIKGNNSFFSRFQIVEHISLQMCSASAILLNNPIFCSGANLAFEKNEWLNAINQIDGNNNLSGDDLFLMHIFKKKKKKIIYIKNKNAVVTTKTEKNITDFMKQRMRWGGKSLEYKDIQTIMLALMVFLTNLFISVSIIFTFFYPNYFIPFVFVMKLFSDYQIIKQGIDFFDFKMTFFDYIIFSIIYPFYITTAALGAVFGNVSWKGRKTKN
ncbi:MAG: glycosyltransferase [Marinilabiliaceae bacterium]|nr:glycosyltransferase [Marinilabiliaceae bacterium]